MGEKEQLIEAIISIDREILDPELVKRFPLKIDEYCDWTRGWLSQLSLKEVKIIESGMRNARRMDRAKEGRSPPPPH